MPDTLDSTAELATLRDLADRCRDLASVAGQPVRMRLFELAAAIERQKRELPAGPDSRAQLFRAPAASEEMIGRLIPNPT